MTRLNKIGLITETETEDTIGQTVSQETKTDIIAEVRSVSRAEFFEGSQNGLSPSFVFRVSMFGYAGQKILVYDGKRYSIYRTYETDDNYIELYAEAEVGVRDV